MTLSKIRLVIHFDTETGFDSSATLPREDVERIAKDYLESVQRARSSKPQ